MIVYLDGEKRGAAAGAVVKHLLDDGMRAAAAAGAIQVLDAWGHVVGLEGAAAEDGSYVVVTRGARPPSVQACLEAWPDAGGLPAEFAKHLVRRAVEKTRAAGGGASPRATAALARAAAERRDGDAMWSYLVGEKRTVAVAPSGSSRVRSYLPNVETVVVATRDLLTFAGGITTFDYLAGCRVVEVGTTNKAKLGDYERVIGIADAVVTCAKADFAIAGFAVKVEGRELAALAAGAGKPTVGIYGGGNLFAEGLKPNVYPDDLAIITGPAECPTVDVVYTRADFPARGGRQDRPLYENAAAVLWQLITGS